MQNFFSSYYYSLILSTGPFHYLTGLPYLDFVLSVSLFINPDVDNQLTTRVYPLPCALYPFIASALSCAYARYHALVWFLVLWLGMGSMAPSDVATSNTDNENILPKHEPIDEALTPDSESLSPEPDSATIGQEGTFTLQDPPPIPKRKGGRKPVCARIS